MIWTPSKGALPFAVALIAASAVMSVEAQAQNDDCVCYAPLGSIGDVSQASGEVLVSQQAGFQRVASQSPVSEGSRVIVGPAGSAVVRLDAKCSATLRSTSTAEVVRTDTRLCLRIADNQSAGLQPGGSPPAFGLPEALFGTLAVGGLTIGILDDDNRVSR